MDILCSELQGGRWRQGDFKEVDVESRVKKVYSHKVKIIMVGLKKVQSCKEENKPIVKDIGQYSETPIVDAGVPGVALINGPFQQGLRVRVVIEQLSQALLSQVV